MRFDSYLSGAEGLDPAESAAWYDVIGRFRDASATFERQRLALEQADTADAPALESERLALLSRAQSIGGTVDYIRTALDDVLAALSGAWDSVTGAWGWLAGKVGLATTTTAPATLQGLGVPLIPIAAVVAALAVLAAFGSSYMQFSQRLAVYQAERAAGRTPEQAAASVAAIADAGGSLLPSLTGPGSLWPLLLLGAGAFLLVRGVRRG